MDNAEMPMPFGIDGDVGRISRRHASHASAGTVQVWLAQVMV